MMESLAWESSDVDWCEANFEITEFVAEFWNTVSNALFFVLPPLLIYLFRQYAQQVTWGVNVVWGLLLLVGVGSVYFHATLSLVGQLLDEIAIIWVFMAAMALWYPRCYLPVGLQNSRNGFHLLMALFTLTSTGLACVMPAINCIALFALGVPATTLLVAELRRCHNRKVFYLGMRCFAMWIFALASWISDRLFCSLWERLGFPYLHCMWHVFIALAAYQALVLFAYFDALKLVPEQLPVISYWPQNSLWWGPGIPYIRLRRFVPKVSTKAL